jgi:hypothetical protein
VTHCDSVALVPVTQHCVSGLKFVKRELRNVRGCAGLKLKLKLADYFGLSLFRNHCLTANPSIINQNFHRLRLNEHLYLPLFYSRRLNEFLTRSTQASPTDVVGTTTLSVSPSWYGTLALSLL